MLYFRDLLNLADYFDSTKINKNQTCVVKAEAVCSVSHSMIISEIIEL